MLDLLIVILVLAWFFGGFVPAAGSLINLLLVIALIVLVVRLARGERVL